MVLRAWCGGWRPLLGGAWAWSICFMLVTGGQATAQSTSDDTTALSWIWSDDFAGRENPAVGARYFRRAFNLRRPLAVTLNITCDDACEVYVNGDLVGTSDDWREVRQFTVTERIQPGRNVLAVKATNADGPAGLLVRLLASHPGHAQAAVSSDDQWRWSADEKPGWYARDFDDGDWKPVRVLGAYGATQPWGKLAWDAGQSTRFQVPEGFGVRRVTPAADKAGIVAMSFDALGRLLTTREGGPIVRYTDADGDGLAEHSQTICDEVRYVQGLAIVGDALYAVGEGPAGAGLYELKSANGDGPVDEIKPICMIGLGGSSDEHGPHAVIVGPDGELYWVLGNFAQPVFSVAMDSPASNFYEGDLLQPRYEDPYGHAVGVRAPGGTVLRVEMDGEHPRLVRVAMGIRNSYDIAFNAVGELFAFDSDMEPDLGQPWYRPVRVLHLPSGAELGWRSGTANWPPYFVDSLPGILDVGRGSPTGMTFYHHHRFPKQYHDVLFAGDWSQGRILAFRMTKDGSSYRAAAEIFATGSPLNVTDMEVGPDGALYFSCGGRGTEGGVFRIDASPTDDATDQLVGVVEASRYLPAVVAALEQPQPDAAWSRKRIAAWRNESGDRWPSDLNAIAADPAQPAPIRLRAIDLLVQSSHLPDARLLERLSSDEEADVRARAADLWMGMPGDRSLPALEKLLSDADPRVQRHACEAIADRRLQARPELLIAVIANGDRFLRFAARRALEQLPAVKTEELILTSFDANVVAVGTVALLNTSDDRALLERIVEVQTLWLRRSLPAPERLDLLRGIQLSARRLTPEDSQLTERIREALLPLFPSDDAMVNRELARLLAYLQEPKAVPLLLAQLTPDMPRLEQIHFALCLRYCREGWNDERRLNYARWLDGTRRWNSPIETEGRFTALFDNLSRDVVRAFPAMVREEIVRQGATLPYPASIVVKELTKVECDRLAKMLIEVDGRIVASLAGAPDTERRVLGELAQELVAALGRAGGDDAMAHLRQRFEFDPERRDAVVHSLAEHPHPDDWTTLMQSVDLVRGVTLVEALRALGQLDRAPENPGQVRSVIVAGSRLEDENRHHAAELLARWHPESMIDAESPNAMSRWQRWFAETYPDLPPATVPEASTVSRWSLEQLQYFLAENPGDAARGRKTFEQARCAQCHRFGDLGTAVGPDLSTVRRRFQQADILQAILSPSQVISDQYRTYQVVTSDGLVHTGMLAPEGAEALAMFDSEGKKSFMKKADIEQQQPSNVSVMPAGLLNPLSLEEIADLMAFLELSASASAPDASSTSTPPPIGPMGR